ncbi:MAG: HIRAN domain-containing protein [Isosphaeraceae bacterium]|nr:HIRAN domain-containing protein [Isosphaeraceae bacterium]
MAGRAYHRGAAVVFGDPASLVREPDYPHDGNVIAVINSSGQCIGCVRRDHAEYFAPAMDAGEIRLTGRLGDVDPLNYEEDEAFPPLILRVEFTSTSAART